MHIKSKAQTFYVFFDIPGKAVHPDEGDGETQEGEGVLHPGVVCDGCEGSIRGKRYKCSTCPDYDLCNPCERKGIHLEHDMMLMRTPRVSGILMFDSPPPKKKKERKKGRKKQKKKIERKKNCAEERLLVLTFYTFKKNKLIPTFGQSIQLC